jgi:hypothetical protein
MPPRTTAGRAGAPGKQPATAGSRRRGTAAEPAAAEETRLQTFAQHTGARPFTVREPGDEKLQSRSFQIPIGVVQRLRATADGVQHRVYDTELQDETPDSISAFVVEAFDALCTFYEDALNNGQEFRRVRRLPPGPGKTGAQRGADKRSEIAAARRAAAGKTGTG